MTNIRVWGYSLVTLVTSAPIRPCGEKRRVLYAAKTGILRLIFGPACGTGETGSGLFADQPLAAQPGSGRRRHAADAARPGTAGEVEYPRSDSNRQHTDFKSVASANWATGARQLPSQAYWKGPEGRKQHDGGPPFRENRRRSFSQVKARPSLPASWPGWLLPGRPGEGSSGCAGWSGRGRRLR